jgi:hypothetical protein
LLLLLLLQLLPQLLSAWNVPLYTPCNSGEYIEGFCETLKGIFASMQQFFDKPITSDCRQRQTLWS